jgi:hypothetical protein
MSATIGRQAQRLFFYCVAGIVVFSPLAITSSDLSGLLYFLVAVPAVSIVLGIWVFQRKSRSRLIAIATVLSFRGQLKKRTFMYANELRALSLNRLPGRLALQV